MRCGGMVTLWRLTKGHQSQFGRVRYSTRGFAQHRKISRNRLENGFAGMNILQHAYHYPCASKGTNRHALKLRDQVALYPTEPAFALPQWSVGPYFVENHEKSSPSATQPPFDAAV